VGIFGNQQRIPFAAVNHRSMANYREGWVRHHLHPLQCLREAQLRPFLLAMRDDGYLIDDFATNGILLPTLPSQSILTGQPLHAGGHPNYNAQILDELNFIRVFCESVRSDSQRRKMAMRALRGSQERAHRAIARQRSGHVDRVKLRGKTDVDLDRTLDRLFAGTGL
jgi:A nuclease family of the HNH/ENDO VII superfamily with conserved AHH